MYFQTKIMLYPKMQMNFSIVLKILKCREISEEISLMQKRLFHQGLVSFITDYPSVQFFPRRNNPKTFSLVANEFKLITTRSKKFKQNFYERDSLDQS